MGDWRAVHRTWDRIIGGTHRSGQYFPSVCAIAESYGQMGIPIPFQRIHHTALCKVVPHDNESRHTNPFHLHQLLAKSWWKSRSIVWLLTSSPTGRCLSRFQRNPDHDLAQIVGAFSFSASVSTKIEVRKPRPPILSATASLPAGRRAAGKNGGRREDNPYRSYPAAALKPSLPQRRYIPLFTVRASHCRISRAINGQPAIPQCQRFPRARRRPWLGSAKGGFSQAGRNLISLGLILVFRYLRVSV